MKLSCILTEISYKKKSVINDQWLKQLSVMFISEQVLQELFSP